MSERSKTEIQDLNRKIERHKFRRTKLQKSLLLRDLTPAQRAKKEEGIKIHTAIIAKLKHLRLEAYGRAGLDEAGAPIKAEATRC